MYESPIEMVIGEFQDMIIQQTENQTLKAIQKVGVNVNKEELLKALKYDRNQYEKGHQDGFKDGAFFITEKLILLFNLEHNQAEGIRVLVKNIVGDIND